MASIKDVAAKIGEKANNASKATGNISQEQEFNLLPDVAQTAGMLKKAAFERPYYGVNNEEAGLSQGNLPTLDNPLAGIPGARLYTKQDYLKYKDVDPSKAWSSAQYDSADEYIAAKNNDQLAERESWYELNQPVLNAALEAQAEGLGNKYAPDSFEDWLAVNEDLNKKYDQDKKPIGDRINAIGLTADLAKSGDWKVGKGDVALDTIDWANEKGFDQKYDESNYFDVFGIKDRDTIKDYVNDPRFAEYYKVPDNLIYGNQRGKYFTTDLTGNLVFFDTDDELIDFWFTTGSEAEDIMYDDNGNPSMQYLAWLGGTSQNFQDAYFNGLASARYGEDDLRIPNPFHYKDPISGENKFFDESMDDSELADAMIHGANAYLLSSNPDAAIRYFTNQNEALDRVGYTGDIDTWSYGDSYDSSAALTGEDRAWLEAFDPAYYTDNHRDIETSQYGNWTAVNDGMAYQGEMLPILGNPWYSEDELWDMAYQTGMYRDQNDNERVKGQTKAAPVPYGYYNGTETVFGYDPELYALIDRMYQ